MPDERQQHLLHYCAQAIVARAQAVDDGLGSYVGEFIARFSEDSLANQVIACAAAQSLFELTEISSQKCTYEEHQTSALMGHLASNLFWSTLVGFTACSSEDERKGTIPNVSWAYQSAADEARSGADFGLLQDVGESEDGRRRVRIVLFQAKKSTQRETGSVVAIDRVTRRGESLSKAELTAARSQQMYLLSRSASQAAPPFGRAAALVLEKLEGARVETVAHFQLEALLTTYFEGLRLAEAHSEWCYYVAWHSPDGSDARRMPDIIPIEAVAHHVFHGMQRRSGFPATVPVDPSSFLDLLCEAMTGHVGLDLSMDDAVLLMGTLTDLLPGLVLILCEESAGGGQRLGQEFRSKGWEVSESLAGLHAVAQTQPTVGTVLGRDNVRGM